MSKELTFFVVAKTGSGLPQLQRIRVEQEVQRQLSDLFDEQAGELIGVGVEPIAFSPTYRVENGDIEAFAVPDFPLPNFLHEAIRSHETIDSLHNPFTPQSPRVKAIVGVDLSAGSFFFQYFERRRILESRRVFLFRNDRFSAIEEPAITVDKRLAATIVDGELRFKSFFQVRQFLDLSALFDDATDETVQSAFEHPKLHVENSHELISTLSARMRKRISLVLAAGILDNPAITPQLIQSRAKRYSGLDDIRLTGAANSRRLVLPTELRKLEKLLRFMCEDLYVGELTGAERISNSSRIVSKV